MELFIGIILVWVGHNICNELAQIRKAIEKNKMKE